MPFFTSELPSHSSQTSNVLGLHFLNGQTHLDYITDFEKELVTKTASLFVYLYIAVIPQIQTYAITALFTRREKFFNLCYIFTVQVDCTHITFMDVSCKAHATATL